jgi:hypothetical protein
MFDAHATARDAPIRGLLRPREGAAPGLPGRHDDLHLVERERQEAQILERAAPRGQRVGRRLGHALLVGTAGVRLTQQENRERHVDEQHVFPRMVFFLAAITARLLSRNLGARDASVGPIVPERGEASAGAGTGRSAADLYSSPPLDERTLTYYMTQFSGSKSGGDGLCRGGSGRCRQIKLSRGLKRRQKKAPKRCCLTSCPEDKVGHFGAR